MNTKPLDDDHAWAVAKLRWVLAAAKAAAIKALMQRASQLGQWQP